MRKKNRLLPLFLVLVLSLSLSVQAVQMTPRWNSTTNCNPPTLSFSNTTATCAATIRGVTGADIAGTLTLYLGSVEVDSWPVSGTGRVSVSGTCKVTRGQTYKLVLDVTVSGSGGTDYITKDTTATCH